MKKTIIFLAGALLLCGPIKAQTGNTTTIPYTTDPTGHTCSFNMRANYSGHDYYCASGVYALVGTGAGSGFPVTGSVHVQSGGTITVDSGATLTCASGSTCPGGVAASPSGAPQVNAAGAFSAIPFDLFSLGASGQSGAGTYASPYSNSTDNTAGVQTQFNAQTTGGTVKLPGYQTWTTPLLITKGGVVLDGVTKGNLVDPNGEIVGTLGTIIQTGGGNGINIAPSPISGSRVGYGVTKNMLISCGSIGSNAGIQMDATDQWHVDNVIVSACGTGIALGSVTSGGYYVDTPTVSHSTIQGAGNGITSKLTGSGYVINADIDGNVISDNVGFSVELYGPSNQLHNNLIVRGCGMIASCGIYGAQTVWQVNEGIIDGNTFISPGLCYTTTGVTGGCANNVGSQSNANNIYISGNANSVTNNNFTGITSSSYHISVNGNSAGNVFSGNSSDGTGYDFYYFGPTTHDNMVWDNCGSYNDAGARNVFCGYSTNAGDPQSAGNWSGHNKWLGLFIRDTTNNVTYAYYGASARAIVPNILASKTIVGTDANGELVDASSTTLANNTTGNAASANAFYQVNLLNDGTNGTVLNETACESSTGTARLCVANAMSHVIGAVTSGAGTTGNPTIAVRGNIATLTYDAVHAVVIGDWAVTSATAGLVTDTGSSTFPTCGNQVVGVATTAGLASTAQSVLLRPDALLPCPSNANQSLIANSTTGWQAGTPPVAATATTATNVTGGNVAGVVAAGTTLNHAIGSVSSYTENAPTFPTSEPTPTAPTATLVATGSGNCTAGSHVFAVTEVTALGQTVASPVSGAVTCDGSHKQVTVGSVATGSAAVTGRNVWASLQGTTTPLYLVASSPVIADNTTTSYTFNVADTTLTGTTLNVRSPAIDTGTSGATGSGAVVLQGQPALNGASWQQYTGLTAPTVTVTDNGPGGGTLLHNTTYCYQVVAFNNIGPTNGTSNHCVTTSSASSSADTHSITVAASGVTGSPIVGYTFYGRNDSALCGGSFNFCQFMLTQSGASWTDTGSVTPSGGRVNSTTLNSTTGLGFGPTSGNPATNDVNGSLNDVWIARTAADSISIIAYTPALQFVSGSTATAPVISVGGSSLNLNTNFVASGYVSSTTYMAATTYSQSGVRTAVLSGANATATCDMSKGNTCWIKPVGGTNVTTLTVSNLLANGDGYDFCILEDGTGGSTVTFAAAPFNEPWYPNTNANAQSCSHWSSPDGSNLVLDRQKPKYVAQVDLTGQVAAVSTGTALYAVPATGQNQYVIKWDAKVTTVDAASSTLGGTNGMRITYTDADDSVVVTTHCNAGYNATDAALNTTQAQISGTCMVNAKASTNIQYGFDYTSGITPMAYSLHIKVISQ